jgi:hypothetical protein
MRTLTILATVLLAAPAFAQDLATGDAIKAAVSGNTIQGSMTSSGPYAEFYAEDGTVKGDGYTAVWCFVDDSHGVLSAEDGNINICQIKSGAPR